jgi:hypothetical protein
MSKKHHLLKKIFHFKEKKLSVVERIIVALIALGVIGGLVLFLVQLKNLFPVKNIAEYLPAKETILLVEWNDMDVPEEFDDIGLNLLSTQLKESLGFDLTDDSVQWARTPMGYSLIKNELGSASPVFFIRASGKQRALRYFDSFKLSDERLDEAASSEKIYEYSQGLPYSFVFVDSYVVISRDQSSLRQVLNSLTANDTTLAADPSYQKTISHLPRRFWLRGHVDYDQLSIQDEVLRNVMEPLKAVLDHFSFTLRKGDNGLHFNTFLNLDSDVLSLEKGAGEERFAYRLTDYIVAEDLALYLGGADLAAEWQNTLESISNLNPAYGIILEGLLRAQLTDVFGAQVDLRNDIYPLFEGEYALAISETSGQTIASLILAHEDREFIETKMEKLSDGFNFLAATFAPKLNIVTLPDGTESRELVPDESRVKESSFEISGYESSCIEVTQSDMGFCYAVTEEIIIMTNNRSTLESIIQFDTSGKVYLSQALTFRKSVSNLSKINDELSFVDINKLAGLFEANPTVTLLKPLLGQLDSATWVKHYFKDGVTAEGFILFK